MMAGEAAGVLAARSAQGGVPPAAVPFDAIKDMIAALSPLRWCRLGGCAYCHGAGCKCSGTGAPTAGAPRFWICSRRF